VATTIFINGKFLLQPITGVQRFAREIVRGLDQRLDLECTKKLLQFVLVVPDVKGLEVPTFRNIKILYSKLIFCPFFWEQFMLPFVTLGQPLLNLTGAAPIVKIRQVCTFHDAAIFDIPEAYTKLFVIWYRFLFRIQSRTCLGILTVSEFSKGRLKKLLGIAPSRIRIVYNGVDHFMSPAMQQQKPHKTAGVTKPYFLAVGSANPSKNFARLVEAFKISGVGKTHSLIIVGGGNAGVFFSEAINSTENVVLLGRVSDDELKTLYQEAFAFLFPSLYEGFGIPLLEAMVCGCPILASNAASVPEVCGSSVIYFDPEDVTSISKAILEIIRNPSIAIELRSKGFIQAQKFSWEHSIDQLLESLKEFKLTAQR